jgi:hypothetical protein
MPFTHACFLSFPREAGKATLFAQEFYSELKETIAVYGKDDLPIFKYDQCEDRRMGDDWTLWIQRELCQSAMMVAVCAPVYFNGSPGCVSEFDGMELLAQKRCAELSAADKLPNWIIGLRLKSQVALPRLNKGYHVVDFFDCVEEPRNVRRKKQHRQTVEALADRIYQHWQWVKNHPNLARMHNANICASFQLPNGATTPPDEFPHAGGVR